MTKQEKISRKKQRLEMYYAAEEAVLGAAQSYSIGGRSLTRANLADIRAMIDQLENEIAVLENREAGKRPRKAFGVIPRDI